MKKVFLLLIAIFIINIANAQWQQNKENTDYINKFLSDKSVPSPAGAITGPDSVCLYETIILSVPPINGATSYIWTLPTGFNGTSDSNSIEFTPNSPAMSGTVTVKGHNNDGDGTASSLYITIKSYPEISFSANPTSGCAPLTVEFTNTTVPLNSTYIWNFGDNSATDTSTNPSHIYNSINSPFSIFLVATSPNGCKSTYVMVNYIIVSLAGINEKSINDFISFYPNPATERITISYSQLNANSELQVYNILGQIVYEENITKGSTQLKLNIQNYKAGLYKVILRENGIIKGQVSLMKQ